MIRRIALQYKDESALELLSIRAGKAGDAICDYADLNVPIRGLPNPAEYKTVYGWYFPFCSQVVFPCKSSFSPKRFLETASDVLAHSRNETARLEYFQIWDMPEPPVTEKSHLGMADLSGNTGGVKIQGSSDVLLKVLDEILSAVQDIPLALLSVICTWQDGPVAEIQMEFLKNIDAASVFQDLIGQYPVLRLMGCRIPEFQGESWHVYVSGSHSPKINTIPIRYERSSGNDFYTELKRSKFWGEPEWLFGDILIDVHKPRSGLARINPFNWSQAIDIPKMVCGRKITTIFIGDSGKHITRLAVPATVKKIGSLDLAKCMHLKEAVLPGVVEIKTAAFGHCKKLKDLWVSEKLKYIEPDAFPADIKPTIHAPAGSFAEQYARSKKYPFEETR